MITVTGSLAFDYIMNFPGKFSDNIMPDKIHMLNLSFYTDKLTESFGGTAGNIAYNLGLLGQPVSVLASAGKDFSGYKKFLHYNKVGVSAIKIIADDFTARSFALVDKSDNQLCGFYPGALRNDDKLSLSSGKTKTDFAVISPTKPEAMINFVTQCIKLKIPYMFDPGMQLPRLTDAMLRKGIGGAKILIGNDYEIALINKRIGKLAVEILITTMGEKGSLIEFENKTIKIKSAHPECICDPVGAGDAYRSGFIAGYLKGFPLADCGMMGAVCAVYTVEKYGTTTHRFTKLQFCDRLKTNFGIKISL